MGERIPHIALALVACFVVFWCVLCGLCGGCPCARKAHFVVYPLFTLLAFWSTAPDGRALIFGTRPLFCIGFCGSKHTSYIHTHNKKWQAPLSLFLCFCWCCCSLWALCGLGVGCPWARGSHTLPLRLLLVLLCSGVFCGLGVGLSLIHI